MSPMIALFRTVIVLSSFTVLAACGMNESQQHAKYEGTPNEWWSDNYVTMLQEVDDSSTPTVAAARPVRMRIF